MRLTPLLATGVAAAALALPTALAATSLPQLTHFSVGSVSLNRTGKRVSVKGSIDCTRHADFHLDLWAYQAGTGALARASIPAPRGTHPSTKRLAQLRRTSACTGAPQAWTVRATAAPKSAKHRTRFVTGAAQVCTVVSVGKHLRYVLQSGCNNLTIG